MRVDVLLSTIGAALLVTAAVGLLFVAGIDCNVDVGGGAVTIGDPGCEATRQVSWFLALAPGLIGIGLLAGVKFSRAPK